jgi:hypothetical protein
MKPQIYTSFEQLDRAIEISKIEREIHYQKIVLHVQRTKESFSTRNLLSGLVNINIPKSITKVLKYVLPLLIQWFLNKKKGS